MQDKKLTRMKRADLIEIIYRLKRREEELNKRVEQLEDELEDNRIKLERSGNVAEAALALSNVFEASQKAADLYFNEMKLRADELLKKAEQKAGIEPRVENKRGAEG